MRIISNFHDYYDYLSSYDDDLLYLRNQSTHELKSKKTFQL